MIIVNIDLNTLCAIASVVIGIIQLKKANQQ